MEWQIITLWEMPTLKYKEIKSIPRVEEEHQQKLDFEQIQLIFKAWLFQHSQGGYSKGFFALFLH